MTRKPERWKLCGTIYLQQTPTTWIIKFRSPDGATKFTEITAKDEADALKQAYQLGSWESIKHQKT